ncbi:unnamed protein product [Rhizoctonia solani]|uniref:NADP-dependent oxidoreductase domain-containing protein n=1 Tax=Rhizoctonia solani TaxID=456999 RepID=A0A8H2XF45_9AGAM|nr:unnamed protein product [Rhizoctonia solani]
MSTETNKKKMTYVRLGNSCLKISRLILGLMSYGNKKWENWILEEAEGIEHIKAAYDAGIQTFDNEKIAKARGINMAQVTLAWSMSKDVISAPIIGATKLYYLIDALDVKLTEGEIKQLDEPYIAQALQAFD